MAIRKYHLTPEGPAPCSADPSNPRSRGCKYGGQHFSTAAEAEQAYSKAMGGELPTSGKKSLGRRGYFRGERALLMDLELSPDEGTQTAIGRLAQAGLTPLVVGGAVRDGILGEQPKDFDIEVHGAASFQQLSRALGKDARLNLTGKSFGVLKAQFRQADGSWSDDVDLALPRRDSKVGDGHRGFEVEVDPTMSLEEATARRDLTVNALLWDPQTKRVVDLHDGLEDMAHQRLRHVSEAFSEDPLRVLRVARFSSKLGFSVADETNELSQELTPKFHDLSSERVRGELSRMVVQRHFTAGYEFLESSGWHRKLGDLSKVPTGELTEKLRRADSYSRSIQGHSDRVAHLAVMARAVESAGGSASSTVEHFAVSSREQQKAVALAVAKLPTGHSPAALRQWAFDQGKLSGRSILLARGEESQAALEDLRGKLEELELLDGPEPDGFDSRALIASYRSSHPGTKDGPWIRELLQRARTEQYAR